MTDKEIIIALKCCGDGTHYCEDRRCRMETAVNALGFIIRQQAEIEELKIKLSSMRMAANSYKMHYEDGKSEGIKEFAERLKKHSRKMQSSDFSGDFWDAAVLVEDIDNLVKEMVGDTE